MNTVLVKVTVKVKEKAKEKAKELKISSSGARKRKSGYYFNYRSIKIK